MTKASPLTRLEIAVLVHVGVLLLGSSWVYGGNIWWMRTALSIWASLGGMLTLLAFIQRGGRGAEARKKALWLMPLLLFSGIVIVSLFNPSFRPVQIDGTTSYIKTGAVHPLWPSTISAELSLRSWWFGTGVYLSGFNLAVILQTRTALRGLMMLIAANTLVLSVLGTLQKLSGAGFYLGAAESPNRRFFSTFIYNNHWGAFLILGLTVSVGLVFRHFKHRQGRDLWHSPFGLALIGVVLIATAAPVSSSRACALMAGFVMLVAVIHALIHVTALRRAEQRNIWPPLVLVFLLAVTSATAIGWLSYRSINERYTETRLVLDRNQSIFGGRAALYHDTWKLASQQPVFGWGLDTYAIGFQMIRPYTVNLRDGTENIFATAHNDWLQSLAETGFAGTTLLVLMAALPLASLPRRELFRPLTAYPLLGCTLVALYAWVEFPFANGAVLITYSVLFFTTIRHAQLTDIATRNRHE